MSSLLTVIRQHYRLFVNFLRLNNRSDCDEILYGLNPEERPKLDYYFKYSFKYITLITFQSAFHDGKQPHWHHETCFFKRQRPTTITDISNFIKLKHADQAKLQKEIGKMFLFLI